jgi:hypothetical protein
MTFINSHINTIGKYLISIVMAIWKNHVKKW